MHKIPLRHDTFPGNGGILLFPTLNFIILEIDVNLHEIFLSMVWERGESFGNYMTILELETGLHVQNLHRGLEGKS